MNQSLVRVRLMETPMLPAIITREKGNASERFIEFFTANISNDNTRSAYARAVTQFLSWCEEIGIGLKEIKPFMIAAYIKQHPGSIPTVKQHLAAINVFLDWMVTGQIISSNPATSVKSPRYSIKKGKTPVLEREDARLLLESIDTNNMVGLRDRALIAIMVYSFARVSALMSMDVKDYYRNGKRFWLRLHEKGGKFHEVPVHHIAEEYLDKYIEAAGISEDKTSPLFRTAKGKTKTLTKNRMSRYDAYHMIRRRAAEAEIGTVIGCHTFRATGITAYLSNGGTLEHAQTIAAHESPSTTKLYDRTGDAISLSEIERIRL